MPLVRYTAFFFFFFFNDTATTEIYTLSLHDALPIYSPLTGISRNPWNPGMTTGGSSAGAGAAAAARSEEHTSELQSQSNLVCRLLLEKKKKKRVSYTHVSGYSRTDSCRRACARHCRH